MSNTNVKALTIVIIEFTVTLAKKKKLKKKNVIYVSYAPNTKLI